MTKKKFALSVLIGLLCLVVTCWGLDFREIYEALVRTNWGLLVPCIVLVLVADLIIVFRWWLIVDAAHPSSLYRIAVHGFVGTLALSTLPFRTGEFVRPFLLKNREGIPFSTGLATCVVERVFDVLTLALMLAIALLAGVPVRSLSVGSSQIDLVAMVQLAFILTLAAVGFLIALVIFRDRFVGLLQKVISPLSPILSIRLGAFFHAFVRGLALLPSFGRTAVVFASSLAIWGLMAIALWGVCIALDLHQLTIPASFGVMTVSLVGVSIPAAPGAVGTYELFCSAALRVYGVPQADAISVAVLHHSLQLASALALGIPALGGAMALVQLADRARTEVRAADQDSQWQPERSLP